MAELDSEQGYTDLSTEEKHTIQKLCPILFGDLTEDHSLGDSLSGIV